MRIADLAGVTATANVLATCAALDTDAPPDYRELAALLAHRWRGAQPPPRRVGVGGGQGAGKSTLSRLIEAACAGVGLRCCVLSLDDFYLPRADRLELAERVHPVLATRGPPGTHNIAELRAALTSLLEPGDVELPLFDKGADDRAGSRSVRGPFDLVVVEGWCIGARAAEAASLEAPINALERERDRDASWRRYVNERLRLDFEPLAEELDFLAFLQVPGIEAVRRWRLLQEAERPAAQRMGAEQVAHFVEHYERISLAMLRELPGRADAVIALDEAHRIERIRFR